MNKKNAFLVISALLCHQVFGFADNSYNSIAQRLTPEGNVMISGQKEITEIKIIDAARPDRGGSEIFEQYCIVCHGTGAAGSPKFGCASAWSKRKSKGMKQLLAHAETGFNFMPMKGTCVDCSQGELEDAIDYMIRHSTQNDITCKDRT